MTHLLMKLDGHLDRQVVAGSMSSPTTASEHLSSKGWDFADRQLWRELGGRNGHAALIGLIRKLPFIGFWN